MKSKERKTPTKVKSGAPVVTDEGWRDLELLLPEDWIQLADEHGFQAPEDRDDAPSVSCRLRALMYLVAHSTSLRLASAAFAAAGIAKFSHVTLHNWLRAAAPFLKALLVATCQASRRFDPARWAGYLVRAVDASSVQRPGAQGTTARLHFALRLNDMTLSECIVTDISVGESLRNFHTRAGTLDVADRGYSNPPSIAAAVDQHGDVLVRWSPPSLPLYLRAGQGGSRLNAWRLASSMRPGECREWRAEVRPKGHDPIPVRLIIVSLPEEKAQVARERARDEHNRDATHEFVFLAGFVMLVSTVPEDRLSTEQLIELYRLRWQVELQFKREKSIGGLDLLPNFLPETIRSWILLKIILSELGRRVLAPAQPAEASDATAGHSSPQQSPSSSDACVPPSPTPAVADSPTQQSPSPAGARLLPPSAPAVIGSQPQQSLSPANAPWECARLGLCFIQRMLLRLPTRAAEIQRFVWDFLRHLGNSKSRGTKRRHRQVADFLARIGAVPT